MRSKWRRGEGERREKQKEEEGQEEEEKKEQAERVTAVELRTEPFTVRTKKTNRRDKRSRTRCLENVHCVAVKSRSSSRLFAIIT